MKYEEDLINLIEQFKKHAKEFAVVCPNDFNLPLALLTICKEIEEIKYTVKDTRLQ